MTLNWWFTLAVAVCGFGYFAVLLYAAYRSDIKREIYVLKALIVAYFLLLAGAVLSGSVPNLLWSLFRPSLATLFLLLTLSKVIDIKRRR